MLWEWPYWQEFAEAELKTNSKLKNNAHEKRNKADTDIWITQLNSFQFYDFVAQLGVHTNFGIHLKTIRFSIFVQCYVLYRAI